MLRFFMITSLIVCMATLSPVAVAENKTSFSQAELDQMMAPVALYPDALLTQILLASTFSGQVNQAVKWSKNNPSVKGDAAVKSVADEKWDPSVSALVAFPMVLGMMGKKPKWVEQMGDAFLSDTTTVMVTVQNLRKKAKTAGNLVSNSQQKVETKESNIVIESTSSQVVYVPAYNPTVVYGTWWWASYPPYYYYPPAYYGYPYGGNVVVNYNSGVIVNNQTWQNIDWKNNSVTNSDGSLTDAWQNKKDSDAKIQNKSQAGNKIQNSNVFKNMDQQRQQAVETLQAAGFSPDQVKQKFSGNDNNVFSNRFQQENQGESALANRFNNIDNGSHVFSGLVDNDSAFDRQLISKRGSFSQQSMRNFKGFGGGRSFSGGRR